jgi:hypothetical protein
MINERSLGVTEARLGLTLLTCLLVVLGYAVLQRLGGTGQPPPVEIVSDTPTEAFSTNHGNEGGAPRPQVLPVQGNDLPDAPYPRTSERPQWLVPEQGAEAAKWLDLTPSPASGDADQPRPFDHDSIDVNRILPEPDWSK